MTKKRRILVLLLWLAGITFPVAGFFGLFPGGREWFDAHTHPEALHITAHMVLFAGLVWMLAYALDWRPEAGLLPLIYTIGLGLGVVQEGLQVWTAGYQWFTGEEYFDLGIDLLGVTLGVLLWFLWHTRPGQRAS